MERHILLPTDFSDNSWSAAVYVMKLYADEVCTFYFLNSTAIKMPTMYDLSNKLAKTVNDAALKELEDLKDLAEKTNTNANHDFKIILSTKTLKDAIDMAVAKYHIDLIVMGTKGSSGVKEIFFGSNTVNIIKAMRICPVLIVPEAYEFVRPKQIAFPTDFTRFYSDKEIDPLKQLADLYNSKIRIVHINVEEKLSEVQTYNLSKLKGYLEDCDHSFHWMPKYAKKAEEINDFIEELDIEILVMLNYKHGFIENIVKEAVIEKIGFHLKIPFLVIPE